MSATIWAPLPFGSLASIWYPGGPVTDDGGGGDTCELAEQDPLFYDQLNNCVFLENFQHSDGDAVVGTYPTYGARNDWLATFDSSAHIIQGAATATTPGNQEGAKTPYGSPQSGDVEINVHVAAFSQLTFSGQVLIYSAIVGLDYTTCAINFEGDGTTNSFSVKIETSQGDTYTSPPVVFDYCAWKKITVVPGNGTLHIYVDDLQTYFQPNTGIAWFYGQADGSIEFRTYAEEANALRYAAIYINNPLF